MTKTIEPKGQLVILGRKRKQDRAIDLDQVSSVAFYLPNGSVMRVVWEFDQLRLSTRDEVIIMEPFANKTILVREKTG